MIHIQLIPRTEFQRIKESTITPYDKYQIIADMCRTNTLAAVKLAGSGHLGSSFSSMDIVVWLYYKVMNTKTVGIDDPQRDIYFSSKGHDVPGLYSVFYSMNFLSKKKFLSLRRFNGLDGHPDINTPGIEANSGSLGMGISKGRGLAWAKQFKEYSGRVFVMTGDGELQEGQIYEALQSTVQQNVNDFFVIVDYNKVQSDKLIGEIVDIGDLEEKFKSFGWHVVRCNGHSFQELDKKFADMQAVTDKPKILIADTIKGRGISFMEHPVALKEGNGLYPWHAGAPDDDSFQKGYNELIEKINRTLENNQLSFLKLEKVTHESVSTEEEIMLQGEPISQAAEARIQSKVSDEYVAIAYGDALVELSGKRDDIVVLDADLASDCKIRKFEELYPERFIENGIAEQDMVSMAGGLARQGLLPVVNSFASFLASRSNEQIYNNASELSKIVYVCHYAGLIPAGPGKSHQSLRDISLLGAMPNITVLQPGNAVETKWVLDYSINKATENCMIRLAIGPSPRKIKLPEDYQFRQGCGCHLTRGEDAVLFAYGPVMLHEALLASELLQERDFRLSVINMPWLNRIDVSWLRETISRHTNLFILEDHSTVGGLGDKVLSVMNNENLLSHRRVFKYGVEGYPAFGTPAQALKFHQLDGLSLAQRILSQAGHNS